MFTFLTTCKDPFTENWRMRLKRAPEKSWTFERKTMEIIKRNKRLTLGWKDNIKKNTGRRKEAAKSVIVFWVQVHPVVSSLRSTNPHLSWVNQSPGKERFLIGLKMSSRKTGQSCLQVRTALWRHYNPCKARMCTNLPVPQIPNPSSKGCFRK